MSDSSFMLWSPLSKLDDCVLQFHVSSSVVGAPERLVCMRQVEAEGKLYSVPVGVEMVTPPSPPILGVLWKVSHESCDLHVLLLQFVQVAQFSTQRSRGARCGGRCCHMSSFADGSFTTDCCHENTPSHWGACTRWLGDCVASVYHSFVSWGSVKFSCFGLVDPCYSNPTTFYNDWKQDQTTRD